MGKKNAASRMLQALECYIQNKESSEQETSSSRITVVTSDNTRYSVDRFCPHKGAELSQTDISGSIIICPKHKWKFDLTKGGVCTNHSQCSINSVKLDCPGRAITSSPRLTTGVTAVMALTPKSGIAVGQNHGHVVESIARKTKPSNFKGKTSQRVKFVRSLVREVVGFAPYERRVMELLKNSKDKRARKLAKRRLGTLTRAKRKVEELNSVLIESRRAH